MTKISEFVKRVFKYNLENPLINRYFNTTNSKNLGVSKFNHFRNMEDKIPYEYSPISQRKHNENIHKTYNKDNIIDDIKYYNQNYKYKSGLNWNKEW